MARGTGLDMECVTLRWFHQRFASSNWSKPAGDRWDEPQFW